MTTLNSSLSSRLDRKAFEALIQAGFEVGNPRFSRQVVLSWLAVFPGDLEAAYYLAKAQAAEGKTSHAISTLERICERDPEYLEAQEELAGLYQNKGLPQASDVSAKAFALGQKSPTTVVPQWSRALKAAKKAISERDFDLAESEINPVLGDESGGVLAAIVHIKIVRAREDAFTTRKLVELYHQRWPECLVFDLVRAETLIHLGDEAEGMSVLHHCVARDIQGQTARRLWGDRHVFLPLWPNKQEIEFGFSIPADIASKFGWNQLAGGGAGPEIDVVESAPGAELTPLPETIKPAASVTSEPTPETIPVSSAGVIFAAAPIESILLDAEPTKADETPAVTPASDPVAKADVEPAAAPAAKDETLVSVASEFDKVAKRLHNPELSKSDGRYPVYVVFSSITGLVKIYGQQTAEIIVKEMTKLAEAARKRQRWGALVFCPDDPANAKATGLEVNEKTDAWSLKLALKDLDETLAKRGEMIGAVMIIGGDEIVPFHQLPNPTDDVDDTIPSDNPYATLDSNYFVPEWPVGRLVGEAGTDAGLLLEQLRAAVKLQYQQVKSQGSGKALDISRLSEFIRRLFAQTPSSNMGYSAAIWRRSSLAAYRPIGEGRSLWVSPPSASGEINAARLLKAGLGYYNLHGMEDTGEWYGQRDFSDTGEGPDYPVALKPSDLHKNGRVPNVVFTEACYGGLLMGKTEQSSIALRFLSLGTPAFVGSSTIAYGSIDTPLIGADLLGYLFWRYLKEGYYAGEALMRAKVGLAQEMTKRQGFLDGEDQKTLISFILYGDPFAAMPTIAVKSSKFARERKHMAVRIVCDRDDTDMPDPKIPSEVLTQVKRALSSYLPGVETAEMSISTQHIGCDSKHHRCPTGDLGVKPRGKGVRGQTVVIFAKQVRIAQRTHYSYARVTLDASGKLIKLAVSR